MNRRIEVLDTNDKRLTADFINEVDFFGNVDEYVLRDYLFVSEIRRSGTLVALIHNDYEKR